MRETYRVPEENIAEVLERIAKLNKQAAKLGVPPITTSNEVSEVERYRDRGVEKVRRWFSLTIEGEAPHYAGWQLAGTLLVEEGGVLIRAVPGTEMPHRFRDPAHAYDCDHCGAAIKRRVTHVVLHEESGTWKQVGSSCIKDFLGHKNPHAIARYSELLGAFAYEMTTVSEPGWGSGRPVEDRWPVDYFLTWAQSVSRISGWIGRARARMYEDRVATVDVVLDLLTPPSLGTPAYVRDQWNRDRKTFQPTPEDEALAEDAIEWALSDWLNRSDSELNDFEHNMAVALAAGSVGRKTAGIVASLAVVYFRKVRERERAKQSQSAKPVPTGRVQIEGTIIKLDDRPGWRDRTRTVWTVRGDDGWRVWGTVPANVVSDVQVGDRVAFAATVERSDKDASFGFYQRPSPATIRAQNVALDSTEI